MPEKQEILTNHASINILQNDTIEYKVHADVMFPVLHYLKEDYKVLTDLSTKHSFNKLIVKIGDFYDIDDECRNFMQKNVHNLFVKCAIVTEDTCTAVKLNLLLIFSNPKVETKLFTNEKDAFNWLNT